MAEATEREVLRIVHEVLGRTDIGIDEDLFDAGATSLSFVRILARIRQELQVTVPVTALGDAASSRNLAAAIETASLQPSTA